MTEHVHRRRDSKRAFKNMRNFLAGRFVGATRDDVLLHEVLKCLYCKAYVQTRGANGKEIELVSPRELDDTEVARGYRKVFQTIRQEFPEVFDESEEMLLDPQSIAVVMKELEGIDLLDPECDPIGEAYEIFIGSYIRGSEGQFFTPRSAAELLVAAIEPDPDELIIDPACGTGGFLSAVVQCFKQQGLGGQKLALAVTKALHGVDKDKYLAGLARVHISLISGGRPTVVCGDSLAWNPDAGIEIQELPLYGRFDVVLTNPPFGSRIISVSDEIRKHFLLARKWKFDKKSGRYEQGHEFKSRVPPQVLFVEKCIGLVRPGGRIGMVVPESLVSSKSYRYVVQHIRSKCHVRAVMGMPEVLFKTSGKGGTHTKTCLIVLEKRSSAESVDARPIFMAEARWCGHDSRGNQIPYDDLPEIAKRYRKHMEGDHLKPSRFGFGVARRDIVSDVLAPRYYDPNVRASVEALEETHFLVTADELLKAKAIEVSTGDEVGKLAYGTGKVPFVRTSDLSNWEIKIDPKKSVSRDLYERLKEKQDVRADDILMVRDGTYLIGTCAIVTQYDEEILYQSHILKIRVRTNSFGLNPYLLLAILSSEVVQNQIKAKRFTQDIIDSLGDRLKEIVLPIPKSEAKRKHISDLVQRVISERIEARELARKACTEVLN